MRHLRVIHLVIGIIGFLAFSRPRATQAIYLALAGVVLHVIASRGPEAAH